MSRPRQLSKVQLPLRVKGFIPMGYYRNQSDPVMLNIEEFEAIRLLDYEGLMQMEAAQMMGISRPTITRIYRRARKKIALSITEARQMIIEGGAAFFDSDWYGCEKCDSKFNNLRNSLAGKCPLCDSNHIYHLEETK